MLNDWKTWCRLCAKSESVVKLEDCSDLPVIVEKYFSVSMSPYDPHTPTTICNECYNFIVKLQKFAERSNRVDKMYNELVLINLKMVECDLSNVRFRYNVDDAKKVAEESDVELVEKADQSTDTSDLDLVVEYDVEEICEIKGKKQPLLRPESVTDKSSSFVKQEQSESNDFFETTGFDDADFSQDNEALEKEIEKMMENNLVSEEEEDLKPLETRRNSKRKAKTKSSESKRENYFPCEICNKVYSRRQTYEEHLEAKHQNPEDLPFVCSKCPKRFISVKKVKVHEQSHLPDALKMVHPCPYCDKKFTKSVNVQAHVRAVHIGDRPFICEECGKAFGTKGALKEHQITHSDERPFQCSFCPKKFKNLPRLKTHEDIHNNTTYVCPHCGLQLNTKRTLKMHMVVHSDEKRYKCHYCGNEYKRSKALKNHLILHTGLRPYVCPFCDKTFANGSNCRSHKKKAHPVELAQLEASGQQLRATNIPKLETLQPKNISNVQQLPQQQMQSTLPINNTLETPDFPGVAIMAVESLPDQHQSISLLQQQQQQQQQQIVHHMPALSPNQQQQSMQVPTVQLPMTMTLSLIQTGNK